MGNFWGCSISSKNATVLSPTHLQAADEAICLCNEDVDGIENIIDLLIKFIERQAIRLKDPSAEIQVESVASSIKLASQIIEKILTEAETVEITMAIGSRVLSAVKTFGETYWIFVGLSFAAYALKIYAIVAPRLADCGELLLTIVEVAKDLKEFREAFPKETDELWKAVNVVAEGAVICCLYIIFGKASWPSWYAIIIENQLRKTRASLLHIQPSRTLTAFTYFPRHLTRRPKPAEPKLIDFHPVGIEKQVLEVEELLDIQGRDPAVAVVLSGPGGVGKSTLAASVIQQLDWSSAEFKYCRVNIDNKAPNKTSHILLLQINIILDFGGETFDLRHADEGRQQIRRVMEGQCCFLFIDNVVDRDYIDQLLPRHLLPDNENSKIRILITSRRNDLRAVLKNQKCKEYPVNTLSTQAAQTLLRHTILEENSAAHHHFDEVGLMNKVAEACRGVPLLLTIYGRQLKVEREKRSYRRALKVLKKGDLYSFAEEEHVAEKLLFVYHKMEEEYRETFLDICVYFHGMDWNLVGHIVDERKLKSFRRMNLVSRSHPGNEVIVHDILRVMGWKEAKGTRLLNCKELEEVLRDESKRKNVKGLSLMDNKSITTLDSAHLCGMRNSLRVLSLGNWVKLEGPTCDGAFQNLRFLFVGDVPVFPFNDASRMDNLRVFCNKSKAGIHLPQLSPALNLMEHRLPDLDYDAFANMQLQNVRCLEALVVEMQKPVNLPQGFEFPASLIELKLNFCKEVPETLCNLTALERLFLDKCKMKTLHEGFANLGKLSILSLEYCPNLISLFQGFQSLHSLTFLNLRGCTRLEELPADFGKLPKLKYLSMEGCENLKALPDNFGGLSSLQELDLAGCIKLQGLKEVFGINSLKALALDFLLSLEVLPESIGNLSALKFLSMKGCANLMALPEQFGQLSSLQDLNLTGCINLQPLPESFGMISLKGLALDSLLGLHGLPESIGNLIALKYLSIKGCENLRALPDQFGGLSSLQELHLIGCINLQQLPEIIGMVSLKCIALESLLSLEQLPQNMGKLRCLKKMSLISCNSLTSLPDDFVKLTTLESLHIASCIKLSALPKPFGQLKSLKEMSVEDCPNLKELPQGFEALPALKKLCLKQCQSLENLPKEFTMLKCLEDLKLENLMLSSFPDGFRKLKNLKALSICFCPKLETLVNDLGELVVGYYDMLEGAAVERIVKLRHCYSVNIQNSGKLVMQWKEKEQTEEEEYPMAGNTSNTQEWERAARRCLFGGKYIQLMNDGTDELIENTMSAEENTTLALIALTQHNTEDLLQQVVRAVMQRASTTSSGRVLFICIRNAGSNGRKAGESMRQILKWLPKGSLAIPSAEIRRMSLIKQLFFPFSADDKVACFFANISIDDRGHQTFVRCGTIGEAEISERLPNTSVEEVSQYSTWLEESMWKRFSQTLKRANIDGFICKDSTLMLDELQGKTIWVIICDLKSIECRKLQQIYKDIQFVESDCQGVWIPLLDNEDYGLGTYTRAIQRMPWASLINPQVIIEKTQCFIVFDKWFGAILKQDALPWIMAWGAKAHPFTQSKIDLIVSSMHNKPSLEFLLEDMDLLGPEGIKVKRESIDRKLIILYAEPPSKKLKIKSKLEQLVQAHEYFNILYVGYFSSEEKQDVDEFEEVYEDATKTMCWPKLSFWDMITFWHRCKYLLNEEEEQLNMCLKLQKLLKYLYIEKRWLVLLDNNEVIRGSENELIDIICKSNDVATYKDNNFMEDLIEILKQ